MRTKQGMINRFSPTPDTASSASPGRSSDPRTSTCSTETPVGSSSDTTSVGRQWSGDSEGHGQAPRACEKCRLSKRRCDKKLPYCDRCIRLNAKCQYLPDPMVANTNGAGAQVVIFQPQSLSNDVMLRNSDPFVGISVSQILSLASVTSSPGGSGVGWRSSVDSFFRYIQPWFAVVHPMVFESRLAEFQSLYKSPSPTHSQHPSPFSNDSYEHPHPMSISAAVSGYQSRSAHHAKQVPLLILAMHLITRVRCTDSGTPRDMFDETYRTAKRMLALFFMDCVQDPLPSIELVQCGALIALYEYGHGAASTAYRTLSQTAATASVIGVRPGLVDPGGAPDVPGLDIQALPEMEQEQRAGVWWGLFILDQFIHKDEGGNHLPFLMEEPNDNTLLPETPASPSACDAQGKYDANCAAISSQRHLSTSIVVGSVELSPFQLAAKISSLLHRALRIDKERDPRPDRMPSLSTFQDLDNEIRRATHTLLNQGTRWELMLDCFSMTVSALFTLYMPYLAVIEQTPPPVVAADTELRTALAALRFACKISTDVSCKINVDLEAASPTSLAVLAAPVGATCYLVILGLTGIGRIFPDERDECERSIAEKFESLRLFSCRWGIAEEMMRTLENKWDISRADYLTHISAPMIQNLSMDEDM